MHAVGERHLAGGIPIWVSARRNGGTELLYELVFFLQISVWCGVRRLAFWSETHVTYESQRLPVLLPCHSGNTLPTCPRVSMLFSSSLAWSCWRKSSSRSSSLPSLPCFFVVFSHGCCIWTNNKFRLSTSTHASHHRIIQEATNAIKDMPLIIVRLFQLVCRCRKIVCAQLTHHIFV